MKHFIFAIACAFSIAAHAAPVGIATGQPTGTNYPMGADIAKACSSKDSPINNVVTDGALENLDKVYTDHDSQYGIVPVDALFYQKGQDPKMMKNIMMVFPFFSVEAHLIVKDGSPISDISQLAGKRVVEGPEGSGTWVTVQVIKKLTGIRWTPVIASQKDGLDQVLAGKADAEFIVAGKPIGLLQKTSGFKLVSVKHPALDNFSLYKKTLISSNTYPGQSNAVSTIKVDNVLVTYAFKNQYQREIGELVGCIARNVEMMQTTKGYHPKWKDVDPTDIERIDWPAHPAAVNAIKRVSRNK
jgi:uncharacterized protein